MNALVTTLEFFKTTLAEKHTNIAQRGENTENITFYEPIIEKIDFSKTKSKNIYMPRLPLDEDFINALVDYMYENNANLIIRAACTLEEVGLCDVKFKLSPIMLLHKCGLLDKCVIAGGAYLDKDDLSLIRQENSSVILTPTFDAGYGLGVANVAALSSIGVKTFLGTMDGKFNPNHDLNIEAYFLRLYTNATMKKENAVLESFYTSLINKENFN